MTTDVNITTAAEFSIRELTGLARTVVLTQRFLPYRPFTLETTQRGAVTFYPGNPDGTSTVLGAGLAPTVLNGFWKDLFIQGGPGGSAPISLNGQAVTSVDNAVALLEDMCAQGQEMWVQWSNKSRRGALRRFKATWHNLHDCAWEMEFDWISRSQTTTPAVLDSDSNVSDTNARASAQNTQIQNAAIAPGFPIPGVFATAVSVALTALSTAVQNAVNAGAIQASTTQDPNNLTRQVIASQSNIVAAAQTVLDTYDAQPPRALVSAGSPSAPTIGMLSLGQITGAEAYARNVTTQTRALLRSAAIQRAVLTRSLVNDLVGVFIARDGDDLRDVAERFYQSRLQWRPLLLFNELTSTALSRNQYVLVPRLTSGSA